MDLLDQIERWWRSNEAGLRGLSIETTFQRWHPDSLNPSCSLNLSFRENEAELLAWQSGMAELGKGHPGRTVEQRHIPEISDTKDLEAVLFELVGFCKHGR